MTLAQVEAELDRQSPEVAVDHIELDEDEEGASAGLFLRLGGQWRWAGLGVRIGLDNNAIEATARLLGIKVTPRMMLDLGVMEEAALTVWSEQAARK